LRGVGGGSLSVLARARLRESFMGSRLFDHVPISGPVAGRTSAWAPRSRASLPGQSRAVGLSAEGQSGPARHLAGETPSSTRSWSMLRPDDGAVESIPEPHTGGALPKRVIDRGTTTK
jgi:hypothetical protein